MTSEVKRAELLASQRESYNALSDQDIAEWRAELSTLSDDWGPHTARWTHVARFLATMDAKDREIQDARDGVALQVAIAGALRIERDELSVKVDGLARAVVALEDQGNDALARIAAATAAKAAAEQALSTAGLRCLDCERLVRGEEFDIADVFAERDAWRAKAEAWERVAMGERERCAKLCDVEADEAETESRKAYLQETADHHRTVEQTASGLAETIRELAAPTLTTPAAEKEPK